MQHATPTALAVPTTTPSPAELAAFGFLARYNGLTREAYSYSLRLWFGWCTDHQLDPLAATRPHLELFIRHLEEAGKRPATINARLSPVKGFYRFAVIDGILDRNPAEAARIPKAIRDPARLLGLDRMELGSFLATAKAMSPTHAAIAVLLGLLGLRVSEACSIDVDGFETYERGHRVLQIVGKGNKPATMPLPPAVHRVLDVAKEDRTTGPLLVRRDQVTRLNRDNVAHRVRMIATKAGIGKHVTPHTLRRSYVTNALDAGVSLRDVQHGARHSDPRTTALYDVARGNLDRHANHTLAAFIAGAA